MKKNEYSTSKVGCKAEGKPGILLFYLYFTYCDKCCLSIQVEYGGKDARVHIVSMGSIFSEEEMKRMYEDVKKYKCLQ